MGALKQFLESIAEIEKKHTKPLFLLVVLFTALMIPGLQKIELETDFTKNLPQELPILQLNQKINEKFSGQDTMIVILTLDDNANLNTALRDIRDPSVIEYMALLEENLKTESSITGTFSIATYLQGTPISTPGEAKTAIMNSPAQSFVSRDYKTAVMYVKADVGNSNEKIVALDNLIRERIGELSAPQGVKVYVTGTPQITVTLFEILGQDSVNTIIYASAIILVLLFFIQRSFSKALVIFAPLTLGLVWAYGTLGWLGVKISVATAGLGAIILGLGVEYGAFMYTRYQEEKLGGKEQLEALKIALPSIGSAIIGSGTTTMVGFLALTLSSMPMLQNLGMSLALGIFFSLLATILVQPIIIMVQEWFSCRYVGYNYRKFRREAKMYRKSI